MFMPFHKTNTLINLCCESCSWMIKFFRQYDTIRWVVCRKHWFEGVLFLPKNYSQPFLRTAKYVWSGWCIFMLMQKVVNIYINDSIFWKLTLMCTKWPHTLLMCTDSTVHSVSNQRYQSTNKAEPTTTQENHALPVVPRVAQQGAVKGGWAWRTMEAMWQYLRSAWPADGNNGESESQYSQLTLKHARCTHLCCVKMVVDGMVAPPPPSPTMWWGEWKCR